MKVIIWVHQCKYGSIWMLRCRFIPDGELCRMYSVMGEIRNKILLKYADETDKCRRNELFEIAKGLIVSRGKALPGRSR